MKRTALTKFFSRSALLLVLLLHVATQSAPPPFQLLDPVTTTPSPFRNKANGSVEVKRRPVPWHLTRGSYSDRSCRLPPLTGHAYMVVWRRRPDQLTYMCKSGRGRSRHIITYCRSGRWDRQIPRCPEGGGKPATVTSEQSQTNPCEVDFGGCDQLCFFDGNRKSCDCTSGYMANGTKCIDIDECRTEKNRCQQICVNTVGSFRCGCPAGFKVSGDETSCLAYYQNRPDHCKRNNGGCSHICRSGISSAICSCPNGFALSQNGKFCQDVDECARWPTPCRYNCEKTPGSFRCSCPSGYMLHVDQKDCIDIDECFEGLAKCSYQCKNVPGSYTCLCPQGYKVHDYNDTECIDCPMNTYKSDELGQCEKCPARSHTNGTGKASKRDCICDQGYRASQGDGFHCEDVDECKEKTLNCSHDCINVEASAFCSCPFGMRLLPDNLTCDDCPMNTYKSDELGQCEKCPARSHTNSTRKTSKKDCICDQGYRASQGDGFRCEDVDECKEKTLPCSHDCINVEGSAFCSCPFGMRLRPDNLTCSDVDECTENTRVCSQLCSNTVGSYVCSCKPGYTLSTGDHFQCIDDDECASGNHNCSHICVNLDGGYYCQCREGFELAADLRTCSEMFCPALNDPEHGRLLPDRCLEDNKNNLKSRCFTKCNEGYVRVGKLVNICGLNATNQNKALAWEYPPALCKKETAPVRITCPPNTTFLLPAGESSVHPKLPNPDTNVVLENVQLIVEGMQNASQPMQYGSRLVTYVARSPESDAAANCSFQVTIADKEPPKVLRCPSTVSMVCTSPGGVAVAWEEPMFSDNVGMLNVTASKSPGTLFKVGIHTVNYTARDIAGNEAVCKFQVNVTGKGCHLPADIDHGSTDCLSSPNEVTCQPSCEDDYALPSNVPDIYVCDLSGVWDPRPWIPHCQARIPTTAPLCPPGSDRVREDGEENNDCVDCPPGMYWSRNMSQCFFCEQGSYQDLPGQSFCKSCPTNAEETLLQSPNIQQQCSL